MALGGVTGLVVGSFLATLVLRWPAGRTTGGRSACDGCGAALGPAELVPLLSYLMQGGRCRRCRAAIDPRHPVIELAAGAVGASALFVSPGVAGLSLAVTGWLLLALAALDAEALWLPDRLTLPFAILGIVDAALFDPDGLRARLLGVVGGFLLLEAIRRLYVLLRRREGMGGGDPKLFGAIGAWLGWAGLPLVLALAGIVGLGWIAARRIGGRTVPVELPLGSLMALAAWPLLLLKAGGLPIPGL